MGTSNWQNISYCVELLRQISPSSVLDVGVGFGRWGMLCREFLDVWSGRVFRKDWKVRVEGIEIFPKNIDRYHAYFYDKIHIADAFEFIPSSSPGEYDIMIMGDVLEHFDKDKALTLLNASIARGKHVLLNIPIGSEWPQGTVYGNEFETHRSIWTTEELDAFPVKAKKHFKDYINRDFSTYLFSSE